MRRGDIYWAELRPRSGSEQQGRRPVVLVSNDGFNRTAAWRSVIVVPLSSSTNQARRGPTAVFIPAGEGGLKKASVALCHQVTTLSREKLVEKVGRLSGGVAGAINQGLIAALDLWDSLG